MKTSHLLSTSMVVALFLTSTAGQHLSAQEAQHYADHEPAVVRNLPDYVREADIDGFKDVSRALFLGRAGIGEYWQYSQGSDTCIGLFYYEDGHPYMAGVCGDPEDANENGFSFTSVVQDDDDVVAQAAWFSGNWDPQVSNKGAVIRYATADGTLLSENDDPLTTLFEESAPITVSNSGRGQERLPFLEGADLTLKTT